jgi:hypothetical protein
MFSNARDPGTSGHNKTQQPQHPQSDCMAQRYVKTVEGHLGQVVSARQWEWEEKLPIFLLVYQASTRKTTGVPPASMVIERELRLPCDAFLGLPRTRSS